MLDKLRRQVRRFIQPLLWGFYRWYLSESRWYHYEGLKIRIHPSVFHPGLLFSTKILYHFAQTLPLKEKRVLELGAGSGMIALGTARQQAIVTATDINPAAIQSIEESCQANGLSIRVLHSDLFDDVPSTSFDYIFINPPYYPKDPGNNQEQAFFCGQEFEYFKRLFQQLPDYIHASSKVYMILTDDCDLARIQQLAKEGNFSMEVVQETRKWGELNLIYLLS